MRKRTEGVATLSSVTGHELTANVGFARELKVSSLTINNVVIAYADAPAFRELGLRTRPAIFLGMRELRAFKRVAIDFTSHKILFDLSGSCPRAIASRGRNPK